METISEETSDWQCALDCFLHLRRRVKCGGDFSTPLRSARNDSGFARQSDFRQEEEI